MTLASYEDFEKLEFRSGTVVKVEPFERAKKPAYKVWVDFGPEFGIKQTSAQVTVHYPIDALKGQRVVGCLNLGTRNIAGFASEFLLVGFPDRGNFVQLITFSGDVPDGQKLF